MKAQIEEFKDVKTEEEVREEKEKMKLRLAEHQRRWSEQTYAGERYRDECGQKGWTFDELRKTCHPWKPIAHWVQRPTDPSKFLTEEELRINEEEKKAAREQIKADAAERRAEKYQTVDEYRELHGAKVREWRRAPLNLPERE